MCATITRIIAVILPGIIALFALSIGGYPKVLKVLFYLRFRPARFYFNALEAIEKLEVLSDAPSTPSVKELKQGIVGSSDVGFKELAEILRRNRLIDGEIEEIILGEIPTKAYMYIYDSRSDIPITPEKMRFLDVIQKGEQKQLRQELYDFSRITRDLQNWAEEITRKRVGNYLVVLIFLYMIAGIYLVATT